MGIAARVEAARQAWNNGDLDGYLSLYDDSIRLHGYAPAPMDKPSVDDFYRMIWSTLTEVGHRSPPLQFHEVLVDDELYCCRFTMTGVHNGQFMGVPASGRPFTLHGITIMRFSGDRVVERWSSADFLSMLTEIGALPAPA